MNQEEYSESDKLVNHTKEEELECAVCLQTCVHPVCLPCSHIFCFLCVKGVANQSKRCAMCRQEIPADFLDNPKLLTSIEEKDDVSEGYQWFYEGRNGWWQYDERTSRDLENAFSGGERIFEVLVAGFLYVVDFDRMVQQRRNDPSRRRRIKRDLSSIPKKGVAGLKTNLNRNYRRQPRSSDDSVVPAVYDLPCPRDVNSEPEVLTARMSNAVSSAEVVIPSLEHQDSEELDHLHTLHSDLHRSLYSHHENVSTPCSDSSVVSSCVRTPCSNPRDPNTIPSSDDVSTHGSRELPPVRLCDSVPPSLETRLINMSIEEPENEIQYYSLDDTEEYNLPTSGDELL